VIMGKIVFIGDSLTKGTDYGGVTPADTFAYKIGTANGYAPADILNKGVSSDTSTGVLARLQADVLGHAPAVCVLMIGINDWSLGVPVATFKSNLQAISAAVRGAGIKLVFITTNFQRGSVAQILGQEQYVRAMEEVENDGVVDFFREMMTRTLTANYMQYFADVVHLSIAGHEYVAELSSRFKHVGFFNE
jgi:lysophospholipase L1-like esterase